MGDERERVLSVRLIVGHQAIGKWSRALPVMHGERRRVRLCFIEQAGEANDLRLRGLLVTEIKPAELGDEAAEPSEVVEGPQISRQEPFRAIELGRAGVPQQSSRASGLARLPEADVRDVTA
jgi:hypothetical protein